jgi:hypothetical protein
MDTHCLSDIIRAEIFENVKTQGWRPTGQSRRVPCSAGNPYSAKALLRVR